MKWQVTNMMLGTVSDLDVQSGVGIIDADDGRLVSFNDSNLLHAPLGTLNIGARVLLEEHEEDCGPHADIVLLSL